jgi:hypothetical protein
MNFDVQNPPFPPPPRPSPARVTRKNKPYGGYDALFEAVASGEWIGVAQNDISGPDARRKQVMLHSLARNHKMRIRTTVQDGRIYIQRIDHLSIAEPLAERDGQPEADGHGD